jgi:hypothetical protein
VAAKLDLGRADADGYRRDGDGATRGSLYRVARLAEAARQQVRERLLTLPRESEWVFTTLRGHHYTPSTRAHHWNRVRCAVGIGDTSLYLASRH